MLVRELEEARFEAVRAEDAREREQAELYRQVQVGEDECRRLHDAAAGLKREKHKLEKKLKAAEQD
eukprot:2525880-Rhodomonas_salina.1